MMMYLNSNNYYSQEANKYYLNSSQWKDFQQCEAKAVAKLNGEYQEKDNKAFQLGHYLHAWNEGVLDQYIEENTKTIFGRNGKKYAEYLKADEAIECLENDPYAMKSLRGDKEVIMTGLIDDVPWKIRVDSLFLPKYFTDLKYLKSLKPEWDRSNKQYVSVIQYWRYDIPAAIYQEIIRQNTGLTLEPLFCVVTKESPPDKAIYGGFRDYEMETVLQLIKATQSRIVDLKMGRETPVRCEECEYCIKTKKLNCVLLWNEI